MLKPDRFSCSQKIWLKWDPPVYIFLNGCNGLERRQIVTLTALRFNALHRLIKKGLERRKAHANLLVT